jgi:hypothetical protein
MRWDKRPKRHGGCHGTTNRSGHQFSLGFKFDCRECRVRQSDDHSSPSIYGMFLHVQSQPLGSPAMFTKAWLRSLLYQRGIPEKLRSNLQRSTRPCELGIYRVRLGNIELPTIPQNRIPNPAQRNYGEATLVQFGSVWNDLS